MSESAISAAGSLGPVTLPRLIGRIFRERATSCLVVEHGGGKSRAYFRKGRPVGINAFAHFRPLGLILMEKGIIDMETLDRSLALKAERQCLHGKILREMGVVDETQLLTALRLQHQSNLQALLKIREGNYRLDTVDELPDWTKAVGLSAQEAILSHLSGSEGAEAVEGLIRLLGSRLCLTSEWKSGWVFFEISREEYRAMELFKNPSTIEDVAEESNTPLERLKIVVAATSCFGLIEGEGEGFK